VFAGRRLPDAIGESERAPARSAVKKRNEAHRDMEILGIRKPRPLRRPFSEKKGGLGSAGIVKGTPMTVPGSVKKEFKY